MTELDDRVLDLAATYTLLRVEDLTVLMERRDDVADEGPGVRVDRLREYVEEVHRRGGELGPEHLDAALSERLTDSESWTGQNLLYEIGEDRVSAYPQNWHDDLDGVTDVQEVLRTLIENIQDADAFETTEEAFDQGGPRRGIPEGLLLDVAAAIGGIDREEAGAQLTELRKEGVVSESADQHPNPRVWFLDADDLDEDNVDEDKPIR